MLFVPISVGGALGLAVALNRKIRGIRFYRLAVFVPLVPRRWPPSSSSGCLTRRSGWSTTSCTCVGLGPQQFLQDPNQALYCIVAMTVWSWLGFDVIIYLAALQGIPQDLLEACEMDGAAGGRRFAAS